MSGRDCVHRGHAPVRVGEYQIHAGGTFYLKPSDLEGIDVVVPLTKHSMKIGRGVEVHPLYLADFGGVPDDWEDEIRKVIDLLKAGRRVLAFCMASHGRTGTFLASLIALLEDVPDPIAEVRRRHCRHAVESIAQAEAIFRLKNQPLPEQYRREFAANRR